MVIKVKTSRLMSFRMFSEYLYNIKEFLIFIALFF